MIAPNPLLADLIALANDVYGLKIATLARLPMGEDAESYLATAADGKRHVVRIERARTGTGEAAIERLEAIYTLTSALHEHGGTLAQVVAPIRTRTGTFTSQLAGRPVAIFSHIAGRNAFTEGISDDELAAVARLLAAFSVMQPATLATLPDAPDPLAALSDDPFANRFEQPIRRAIAFADTATDLSNDYQRQVCALLLANRADLLATLADMQRRAADLASLAPEIVITHGDPNLANILIDTERRPHLIDWDGLALGPRERDLFAYIGPRFPQFLRAYAAASGPVTLHAEIFAFYNRLWALQEIADYTTRILFENTSEGQDRHAWTELQPYLPYPHARIQAETQATERTIAEVLGEVASD